MDITNNELNSVERYIKRRQTAILVIMFTDIVGYTKMTELNGEKYMADLVEHHNEILTTLVEKNDNGKVIKYIGDSVMAVFSEPTKAVECAQEIHAELDKFNNSQPELDNIQVRIGLHMGQVAIDNKLKGDILGRHVNRASRIESLAGARQTYLSYPVFDSAKGWLQENCDLGWKYHGDYFLKGIDKPAEIYQVYHSDIEKAKKPVKGKKKRKFPSFIFLIAALVLGGAITFGILNYSKTEVYLFDFAIQEPMIDGVELFIDGNDGDHKRALLNKLKPGIHVIHYDISPYVRYYAEFEVLRGENFINLEYKRATTPYFEFETNMSDGMNFKSSLEKEFAYYDTQNSLKRELIRCDIEITKSLDGSIVTYNSSWKLYKDGELYKTGEHESLQNISSKESNRGEWIKLAQDNVYVVQSKSESRAEWYGIEIMLGWY